MPSPFHKCRNEVIQKRYNQLKAEGRNCLECYEVMSAEKFEICGYVIVYSADTIKKIICEGRKENDSKRVH